MADKSLRFLLFGEDKTASKAVKDVEHETEGAFSRLGSGFGKLGGLIGGEFGEILNKVGEGFDKLGEEGKAKLGAIVGVVGGVTAGLGAALQAAGSADQAAHQQLAAAIEATGNSIEDYEKQIELAVKANEKFGHGASDTQQALAKITEATRDPSKALQEMGLVSNLAAAKHISLADAAAKVAKTFGGSTKLLKEYGVSVDSAALAAKGLESAQKAHEKALDGLAKAQQRLTDLETVDAGKKSLSISQRQALARAHDAVAMAQQKVTQTSAGLTAAQKRSAESAHSLEDGLDQVNHALSGQAVAAADTYTGKLAGIRAQLGDWVAEMGQKIGPAVQTTGLALMGLGAVAEMGVGSKLLTAAKAVKAFTLETVIQGTATKAAAAAEWLLNLAMDANPITLVILTVIGLGAALVVAYQKVGWFRDAVNTAGHWAVVAFGWVLSAVTATWHWMSAHWPILVSILTGPIGAAVVWITRHWSTVEGFFKAAPGRIGGFLAGVGNAILSPFRWAFNTIADMWNSTIGSMNVSLPGWMGGYSISMPSLPHVAKGGIATRATAAMIGEGGEPEAIVPLSKAAQFGFGGGTRGDIHVTVHVHGLVQSPTSIATAVTTAIKQARSAGWSPPSGVFA